jgi:probable rRNA maturation factor
MDSAWANALDDINALCTACAQAAAKAHGASQDGELSIAFVNDAEITRLNTAYRGKDGPTNVLSFPADGHNPAMGDIVIALETCKREAVSKAIALRDHTAHLLIHGYLHLCGYDHETKRDAQIMENLETIALKSLTIPNPYEDNNA